MGWRVRLQWWYEEIESTISLLSISQPVPKGRVIKWGHQSNTIYPIFGWTVFLTKFIGPSQESERSSLRLRWADIEPNRSGKIWTLGRITTARLEVLPNWLFGWLWALPQDRMKQHHVWHIVSGHRAGTRNFGILFRLRGNFASGTKFWPIVRHFDPCKK